VRPALAFPLPRGIVICFVDQHSTFLVIPVSTLDLRITRFKGVEEFALG